MANPDRKAQLHVELDEDMQKKLMQFCPEPGMKTILVRKLLTRFFSFMEGNAGVAYGEAIDHSAEQVSTAFKALEDA